MTTPIRPGLTTPLPAVPPQRSAQALAAQRAFFSAAMDRAGSAAATPTAARVAATSPGLTGDRTASVPPAAAETANDALPRPGRLLDIRV